MSYRTDYSSIRDVYSWIEQLVISFPYIQIDFDQFGDEIVIINTKTKDRWRIHRYDLEYAKDPKEVVMYGITKMIQSSSSETKESIKDIIEKEYKARIDSTMGGLGLMYDPSISVATGAVGSSVAIGSSGLMYDPLVMATTQHALVGSHQPHKTDMSFVWPHKTDILFNNNERIKILEVKREIKQFLNNHIDRSIFDMKGVIVAGGCFASMINNEEIKDIDVFILDNDQNRSAVCEMINLANLSRNPNAKIGNNEYMDDKKIEATITYYSSKIQFIVTQYKTRRELINNFDFQHCCVSYDYTSDKLFLSRETFDAIKSKTLIQNDKKYGFPKKWRYEKFWKRGWKSEVPLVA